MTGMLAQVQVGQQAILHELEHGFELAVVAGEQPGLTIIEMLPDHIVLEDVAGGVISRVPNYLIKAVRAAESPAPEVLVPVETPPPQAIPSAA
jgi:hypothetical protein